MKNYDYKGATLFIYIHLYIWPFGFHRLIQVFYSIDFRQKNTQAFC